MSDPHRIDKTLFAAGIQCAKRLYQEFHEPNAIPTPSESRQLLVKIGHKLTEMAREGFPRGERVEDAEHAAAVEHTIRLMEEGGGVAIFDAAFERDGVEVRCDILLPSRNEKTVDIFEVKSGTRVKPRHVMDVALQMWAIEGCGYTVRSASLLHLDAEYRHSGGKNYPVHRLFKSSDITKKARKRKRRIADYVDNFQNVLGDESTMELPTGTWCITPIPCAYLAACRRSAPDRPLLELPDITPAQESELHQEGIETIDQIDAQAKSLTLTQRRVLRAIEEDTLILEPIIAEEFDTIVHPICFVSTDLSLQVMPRYERSRPWQHIPYMWSAHILNEDGTVEHRSFVARGPEDPRPDFVTSLAACIDDVGTVITWSNRLEPALRSIMEDLTKYKEEARCLLQMDPIALDQLVREGAYHPAQRGSYELGDVHAALTGEAKRTGGKGQGIYDEEGARAAFEKLLNSRTRANTREKLTAELEAYETHRSKLILDIHQVLAR